MLKICWLSSKQARFCKGESTSAITGKILVERDNYNFSMKASVKGGKKIICTASLIQTQTLLYHENSCFYNFLKLLMSKKMK